MSHNAFTALLGAGGLDALAKHWAATPMLVKSAFDTSAPPIDLSEVERTLVGPGFLARANVQLRTGNPPTAQAPGSLGDLYDAFAAGGSIQLVDCEDWLSPVHPVMDIVNDAQRALEHPIQTVSMFLTPPNAQALPAHHDQIEIITLQISGEKRWETFAPTPPDLLPSGERSPEELGPVKEVFTLQPGDLFYIPRGVPHRVVSNDEVSLSLAISFQSFAFSSMTNLIYEKAVRDADLSRSFPVKPRTALSDADIEAMIGRLHAMVDQLTPADVRAMLYASEMNLPVPPHGSVLEGVSDAADVSPDDSIVRRPGAHMVVGVFDDKCCLSASAFGTFNVPAKAREALEGMLAADTPVRIADLPGPLSPQSKATLARRFIKAGLFERVRCAPVADQPRSAA